METQFQLLCKRDTFSGAKLDFRPIWGSYRPWAFAGAVAPSVRQPFSYVKGDPTSNSYVNKAPAVDCFCWFWFILADLSRFWLAWLGSITIGMRLFGWFWTFRPSAALFEAKGAKKLSAFNSMVPSHAFPKAPNCLDVIRTSNTYKLARTMPSPSGCFSAPRFGVVVAICGCPGV